MIWKREKQSFSEKKIRFVLLKHFGIKPNRIAVYHTALVHKSYLLKKKNVTSNERLEFLGDAFLGAFVAEYLYKKYPEADEGFLSKVRSKVVSRKNLNQLAFELGINQLVYKNISKGTTAHSIGGNALEALLGAIYLDRGSKRLQQVLHKILSSHINVEQLIAEHHDYKSLLFEYIQREKINLEFTSLESDTPSGRSHFVVALLLNEEEVAIGEGSSKKKAQQEAAKTFLEAKHIL